MLNNINDYIGKTFLCNTYYNNDFEGCIGIITDAWYESPFGDFDTTYMHVVGDYFSGDFHLGEGEIITPIKASPEFIRDNQYSDKYRIFSEGIEQFEFDQLLDLHGAEFVNTWPSGLECFFCEVKE